MQLDAACGSASSCASRKRCSGRSCFPILLAVGLGIAFRNTPADVLTSASSGRTGRALESAPTLAVEPFATARRRPCARCATGKVALLVERPADGSRLYRYDDTNPEGRDARMLADVRRAARAGRTRSRRRVRTELHARGRIALHRLPRSGPARHEPHGRRDLGPRLRDRRRAAAEAAEAARRDADAAHRLPAVLSDLAPGDAGRRGRSVLGFAVLVFGVPMRGSLVLVAAVCVLGALAFGALGLLIASRAQTIEAASGLMNLVMVPMWMLSGVFFSSQRFPDACSRSSRRCR